MTIQFFKNHLLSGLSVLLLLFSLLNHNKVSAQEFKPSSYSVGYFGPIPNEPGLRLAVNFPIKSFEKSALILNGHIGSFNKKNDNFNALVGAELGWALQKPNSKNRHIFSLGSGYLLQSEVSEFSVNLQGKITVLERSLRHIFMPTVNYEYGRLVNDRIALFGKVSYGYRIAPTIENAGSLMWEFGVRFLLNKKA